MSVGTPSCVYLLVSGTCSTAHCSICRMLGTFRFLHSRRRCNAQHFVRRLKGWNCHAVIVKSGDDCRQELLAMQLIHAFQRAFDAESLPLWLKPYQVVPVSRKSALIQLLPDAVSIHSIKKKLSPGQTLADHFFFLFPIGTPACEAAQRAFAQSLAAYSLVCYILQVKDRHNANILLDRDVRHWSCLTD